MDSLRRQTEQWQKELLEKLYELKIDLEQAQEEAGEQVDKIELEIENIDAELKSLRSQTNLLEIKKKAKNRRTKRHHVYD